MKTKLLILLIYISLAGFGQTLNLNYNTVQIDASGNMVTSGYFSASKNTLVNRYYVGTKGNFTTIASAITWLTTNMTAPSELILDGGNHLIADSIGIQLPYELSFRGFSYNTTTIQSTTGLEDKPMFVIRSAVSFERFNIDGSNLVGWGDETKENAFDIMKDGLYCEFRNMDIDNAYRGINLNSGSEIFLQNAVVSNCIKGVEVNTTSTNYYKVNFTNGSTYACKWTLADNKFTYQPTNSKDVKIWISGNVQVNQNSRTVDIAIVKNAGCGTSPVLVNNVCLYSPMSCRLPSQNVPYPFSIVAYVPDVVLNDYFELWVTSSSSGDVVIVQDLTIYVEAN